MKVLPRQPTTFTILCGEVAITHAIITYLEKLGFRYDPGAELVILFDVPRSFALDTIKTLNRSLHHLVIVTGMTYPEYLADLWDLQPDALLVQSNLDQDLSKALDFISNGKYYRNINIVTRLTLAERKILSYVARGYDDKEIAVHLTLRPQSVSNTLSRVLGKLELKNRTQAALYYWGIWHFLDQIYKQDWKW